MLATSEERTVGFSFRKGEQGGSTNWTVMTYIELISPEPEVVSYFSCISAQMGTENIENIHNCFFLFNIGCLYL